MNSHSDSSAEITLGLLKAVGDDESLTQRSAASELGIALGLVNTYLKRCIHKGYVKVRQVPRNRYAYYLTPKGFAEKSRLTAEFLSQSLNLFRQAQADYGLLLEQCRDNGWKTVALYGASDLVEIVGLISRDYPVQLIGLVPVGQEDDVGIEIPNLDLATAMSRADVFFLTDLRDPQGAFNTLSDSVSFERILSPLLLEVDRRRSARSVK